LNFDEGLPFGGPFSLSRPGQLFPRMRAVVPETG